MAFIETPLSVQVLRSWKDRYDEQGSLEDRMELDVKDPFFRIEFMKTALGREYIELECADGAVLEYHQMERKSTVPGVRMYSESVTFRKGSIEEIVSWDFFMNDPFSDQESGQETSGYNLWVLEQDEIRAYDHAPSIFTKKKGLKGGRASFEETFVTQGFTADGQYPAYSVDQKLDALDESWAALQVSADNFSKRFEHRFVSIDADECDSIYMLTTVDGNDYLVNLGGRHFIDAATSCPSLIEGLKKAYLDYHPRLMEGVLVSGVDEALERLPEQGSIAFFTTKDLALRLFGKTEFEYGSFRNNRVKFGEREIRIGLKKDDYSAFLERFIDCLFCEDEYESLGRWYDGDAAAFREMVRKVERSPAVVNRDQQTGFNRMIETTGLPPDKVLSDEEGELLYKITEEIDTLQEELKIRDEFIWWCDLRDRLGLVISAPLDHKRFMKPKKRQEGFRDKFVSSYLDCGQFLAGLDYDMFLRIDPERFPSTNGVKHEYKRRGVGNIIFDFGGRSLVDMLGDRPRSEQKLRLVYDGSNGSMMAHLFKGRLLRQMLDRMLPDEGGTVAVDTCPERAEEMYAFCDRTEDPHRLRYRGVDLVFVNRDARERLGFISGKENGSEKPEISDETAMLADFMRDILSQADDD